jgi:hypothetical protein
MTAGDQVVTRIVYRVRACVCVCVGPGQRRSALMDHSTIEGRERNGHLQSCGSDGDRLEVNRRRQPANNEMAGLEEAESSGVAKLHRQLCVAPAARQNFATWSNHRRVWGSWTLGRLA